MIAESKLWRSYSVETIASECGFTNRSNFSKIFTEIKGVSPNDFILQHRDYPIPRKIKHSSPPADLLPNLFLIWMIFQIYGCKIVFQRV